MEILIGILVVAAIVGAVFAKMGGASAAEGALQGGCMAGGCMIQLVLAALPIIGGLVILGLIFGD